MASYYGPDSITTSLQPANTSYIPQNLSAMPSITVQGPSSSVPISTYGMSMGGIPAQQQPSAYSAMTTTTTTSNPLAQAESSYSPHATTFVGQSSMYQPSASATRTSTIPYGATTSMSYPMGSGGASMSYQPSTYNTTYGGGVNSSSLPLGKVYQPPGTDYVPPGTNLRGGMHPIYDVSAVPTFEAPITFSTGNGPFPSLMSRAAAEEEIVRQQQQQQQQQQQYQMQQQQQQQQMMMMMQNGGGSQMEIGTRGGVGPDAGDRINMRVNKRSTATNSNKQRRGCC